MSPGSAMLSKRAAIDAISIFARIVMDHVAEVNANRELHASDRDVGIPHSDSFLNGDSALDCVHDTRALRQEAITSRVDDPPQWSLIIGKMTAWCALRSRTVAIIVGTHECAVSWRCGRLGWRPTCGRPSLCGGLLAFPPGL